MLVIKNKEKLFYFLFFSGVFIFSVVFFVQLNPRVIFNCDDWLYTSYVRMPIPLWGDFNPARVFPEFFMRLCTDFGVYFIMPFTGDYIGSISMAYGLVFSVFVLIYIFRFTKFIEKKFKLNYQNNIFISFIFFIFHFWAFRVLKLNNYYLFWSPDVACSFFSGIPNLLNASLILYIAEKQLFSVAIISKKKVVSGFLFLLLYLGIFSNLYHTIITVSYMSYIILKDVFLSIKSKTFSVKKTVHNSIVPLSTILIWIVSLFFEYNGQRARNFDKSSGLELLETIRNFGVFLIHRTNLFYDVFLFVIIVSAFVMIIIKNVCKHKKSVFVSEGIAFIYCFAVSLVFIILLCSKVESSDIKRPDLIFPIFFYLHIICSIALCYLLKENDKLIMCLPVLCLIVFCSTFIGGKTFADTNDRLLDHKICKKIDNYIVETVKDADRNNKEIAEVHVPDYKNEGNWPQSTNMGGIISSTLYHHNITTRPIHVVIIPDEKVNKKFGIEAEYKEMVY